MTPCLEGSGWRAWIRSGMAGTGPYETTGPPGLATYLDGVRGSRPASARRMIASRPLVSAPASVACTWCGTHHARYVGNCTNCGGPLPGPAPADPGPAPPRPPREIPGAYVRRLYLKNVPAVIGAVFVGTAALSAAIPLAIAAAGEPDAAWFALLGVVFGLVGGPLLAIGLGRARGQLRALREGVAAPGTITDLFQDTSESINGRHPWVVAYAYDVAGRRYEDRVRSWAAAGTLLATYAVGSPVHVVYLREAPGESALYPPIR